MKLLPLAALFLGLVGCSNTSGLIPITVQPSCSCPAADGGTEQVILLAYNVCAENTITCGCTSPDATGNCCAALSDAGCTQPAILSCSTSQGPDACNN